MTSTSFRAVTPREAWRLAGLLFLGGTLSSIPAAVLVADHVDLWRYAAIPIGLVTGLLLLLLPRFSVNDRWLHLVPMFAIAQIGFSTVFLDFLFVYLYFFVAVWVAAVFPKFRQMWFHLLLLAGAPFLCLLSDTETQREAFRWALSVAPALILISIVIGRLTAGLEASRQSYEQLSGQDGLTGVGNYRSLMVRLTEEISRHRRRQREFALLVMDLDNFKAINETQGHLVGDLALALVGSMLDLEVRTEDMVFRQGGDEFSVIAPETSRDQAIDLAGRLEDALAGISAGRTTMSATVSVAVYPHDGEEAAELIDFADTSLYQRRARERGPQAHQQLHQPGG